MAELHERTTDNMQSITNRNWVKAYQHVQKVEKSYIENDLL
ncbi:TPA: hypothetical protein N0F65_012962 [Lagenidium giganteum]|uniref:Uncharacterized protein n=1 Tax=Lagenidium giganteum TaxID=4803 RepID=A0AAV2YZH6_9STRA|nr:TPA: hypothetical protein N0F65_012962 [Lagenidium giganteum]